MAYCPWLTTVEMASCCREHENNPILTRVSIWEQANSMFLNPLLRSLQLGTEGGFDVGFFGDEIADWGDGCCNTDSSFSYPMARHLSPTTSFSHLINCCVFWQLLLSRVGRVSLALEKQ